MNFVAKVWNEPATGCARSFRPRDCMIGEVNRRVREERALPGPAFATVAPEARNRPVPTLRRARCAARRRPRALPASTTRAASCLLRARQHVLP